MRDTGKRSRGKRRKGFKQSTLLLDWEEKEVDEIYIHPYYLSGKNEITEVLPYSSSQEISVLALF